MRARASLACERVPLPACGIFARGNLDRHLGRSLRDARQDSRTPLDTDHGRGSRDRRRDVRRVRQSETIDSTGHTTAGCAVAAAAPCLDWRHRAARYRRKSTSKDIRRS